MNFCGISFFQRIEELRNDFLKKFEYYKNGKIIVAFKFSNGNKFSFGFPLSATVKVDCYHWIYILNILHAGTLSICLHQSNINSVYFYSQMFLSKKLSLVIVQF